MLKSQLKALQIFSGVPESAADTICESLITKHYETNATILNEGHSVQALWLILEGECIVSRTANNQQRTLANLAAGDVFGEMSFVRDAPHSASIVATTDVTVCAYRRGDFLKLAEEQPTAALTITSNIAAVLAERLKRMDHWVCEIMDRPGKAEQKDEWQEFRSAVYTNWNF